MSRNREIKIRVTKTERELLKHKSNSSNLSQYIRNKLFNPLEEPNLDADRDIGKIIPEINRNVYVELSQISVELEKLGNWGEDLSSSDRYSIANIRAKIAEIGLKAIGGTQN